VEGIHQRTSIEEVLQALAEQGSRARIVAGATDLILEMERGVRKGIDTLVDVTRIQGLDQIRWMKMASSTWAAGDA
jgi:CO/xanthine dehydrogenase FAD-binding subunit